MPSPAAASPKLSELSTWKGVNENNLGMKKLLNALFNINSDNQ